MIQSADLLDIAKRPYKKMGEGLYPVDIFAGIKDSRLPNFLFFTMEQMGLQEQLVMDLKGAMKAGETLKVSVVRMLRSAIKYKEIQKGKGKVLSEGEVLEVISSSIKKSKEAIALFSKGGRKDLEEKETKEVEILRAYLPAALTEEALRKLIGEVIKENEGVSSKDFGKVMKAVIPKVVGRADGGLVSRLVREILNG